MALGAARGRVLRMILRESTLMVLMGTAVTLEPLRENLANRRCLGLLAGSNAGPDYPPEPAIAP
jgi:hypothetical protein